MLHRSIGFDAAHPNVQRADLREASPANDSRTYSSNTKPPSTLPHPHQTVMQQTSERIHVS
eukprot:scaffold204690_cov75-Cyclotella_meneghiniana.AAC.7